MNRILLFSILLMTVVMSCGRADKHVIAVPKDASFVLHINGAALSSKISWEEIKNSNWFKRMHAQVDDSTAQSLLQAADSSGINTQSDLVLFSKRTGSTGYSVFEGTLSNAGAFEAFNKKMNSRATGAKEGELNILKSGSGITTWTDTRFIYINAHGGRVFPGPARNMVPGRHDENSLPYDSLLKIAKQLYALDNDENLLSDKRFASLIKQDGDMHLWSNAEYAFSGADEGFLSLFKPDILFEGNITAGTINFENGKISMKSKTYYNDEMAKVYEKYNAKNFDMSVLNRIPSQNIVGVFGMSYPPEGVRPFLRITGLDGPFNALAGRMNFTLDDFIKANKGEVLLAFSDFDQRKPSEPDELEEGPDHPFGHFNFNFLLATSVNDKAAFEKLLSSFKGKTDLTAFGSKFNYTLNDNWFVASNSDSHMKGFLAGGNSNLPFTNKLSGHPVVFYLDLQKIITPLAADSADTNGDVALDASRKIWENIIVTGGEITDGAFNFNFEVNMVDKNTNSLKQLNQYLDRMSQTRISVL